MKPSTDSLKGRERRIENAIIEHPEGLGYPEALAIRNWWVAPASGRVDIGLLPSTGDERLVLIEVKAARAPDAASKVVGQILMYYAGALSLGSQGLSSLRRFAHDNRAQACSPEPKTVRMLSGGIRPREAAWKHFGTGERLLPSQLALFVALDAEPHRALRPTLAALKAHHDLTVRLVLVRNGSIDVVN